MVTGSGGKGVAEAATTRTWPVPVNVPSVPVMVAVPRATPCARPVLVREATPAVLVVHVVRLVTSFIV